MLFLLHSCIEYGLGDKADVEPGPSVDTGAGLYDDTPAPVTDTAAVDPGDSGDASGCAWAFGTCEGEACSLSSTWTPDSDVHVTYDDLITCGAWSGVSACYQTDAVPDATTCEGWFEAFEAEAEAGGIGLWWMQDDSWAPAAPLRQSALTGLGSACCGWLYSVAS